MSIYSFKNNHNMLIYSFKQKNFHNRVFLCFPSENYNFGKKTSAMQQRALPPPFFSIACKFE